MNDEHARDADAAQQQRPNRPPTPFGPDGTWEGRCAGNRSMHHMRPIAKTETAWRCGSCGQWLSITRFTSTHKEP